MNTPLHFLWKRLKAWRKKRAVRVRHNAVTPGFLWSPEDLEAFWMMVWSEEMFD